MIIFTTVNAVCCIYHKPRRFDESSSEEESNSDSESECRHNRDHSSHAPSAGGSSSGGHQTRDGPSAVNIIHEEKSEPNAYEKQPPSKGKRKTGRCCISDPLKVY